MSFIKFCSTGNRDAGRAPLYWEARVKIALGTARGLAHIHSATGPKFSHGNIKSSNVLLTPELDASVSDFGLTPLMNFPPTPPRSAGYRAPEFVETKKPPRNQMFIALVSSYWRCSLAKLHSSLLVAMTLQTCPGGYSLSSGKNGRQRCLMWS